MPEPVAVAAPHPFAVRAGEQAAERGGTAVDVAVAAAMALSVCYPHMCGIGGDLFALVRRPDGSSVSVNASGACGSASWPVDGPVPVTGPRAVTVPGAVSGWAALLELGGSLPVAELLAPAIAMATDGVPVPGGLAAGIGRVLASDAADAHLVALLSGVSMAGVPLRQPALAGTLRTLAGEGLSSLYDGTVADRLAQGFADLGVPVTQSDLRAHRAVSEVPWTFAAAGLEVSTSPPNSQGYLLLALLGAAERLGGLAELDPATMVRLFRRAESCRDAELADPAHVRLGRAELIDPGRLLDDGPLAARHPVAASGDTVAVSVVSADGTAVSLIQSLFHSFGSQVMEPSTGVILHNRGAMFSSDPASPNFAEPGKRPAHTLMPVVVEHADGRVSAHGAMGGRAQPQIHLQVLRHVLAGRSPQEAVSAPRFVVRDGAVLRDDVGHAMVSTRSVDGQLAVGADPRSDA